MALTNSDISDPTVHSRAEDAFCRVTEMLRQRPETPTDTQIVLDIRSDATGTTVSAGPCAAYSGLCRLPPASPAEAE